jgi:ribonuclease-3
MGITRLIMASGRSIQHNSYIGGNAFEALVGALYLDRGYDACMTFWNKRVMGEYLNADKIAYKEMNFKSKLLEWSSTALVLISQKYGFTLLWESLRETGFK